VFEVGVLRRSFLFGPKAGEIIREWGKLLNEHDNAYSSPDIIRVIIKEDYVGGACSAHRDRPEVSIKC